jgi:hypothetical protein
VGGGGGVWCVFATAGVNLCASPCLLVHLFTLASPALLVSTRRKIFGTDTSTSGLAVLFQLTGTNLSTVWVVAIGPYANRPTFLCL